MIGTKKSYALPNESIPSLGLENSLEDILSLQRFLTDRDISTANTRIDRYINYLQKAVKYGPNDAAQIFKNSSDDRFQCPLDWLLYVLREVHELGWILKGLHSRPPIGIDEKLQIIVSGSDFAALDKDSQSRDTQFELRIASYFCQAGYEVDLSQLTDVIVSTPEYKFYIECKRVSTASKLQKRLQEARKQLAARMPKFSEGRQTKGCVAVDVTKIAFRENGFVFSLTNEHSKDVVQEKLVNIVQSAQQSPLFTEANHLQFYWFQIHVPGLVQHPPTPITRFSTLHILKPNLGRKDRKAAKHFYDAFETISRREDPRGKPSRKLVPRRNITLPAGTKFEVDNDLLAKIISNIDRSPLDREIIVGELWICGVDYQFTAEEVEMLHSDVLDDYKKILSSDPIRAGLMILLELYLQRFPYETDHQ